MPDETPIGHNNPYPFSIPDQLTSPSRCPIHLYYVPIVSLFTSLTWPASSDLPKVVTKHPNWLADGYPLPRLLM